MSPFANVPTEAFDVVYVDFPWWYPTPTIGATYVNAAARVYPLMTDDDLLAFPLKSLVKPRGVVLMWATCPRLNFAIRLGDAQGLTYKGVPFVWVKTNQDGTVMKAKGMNAAIVKPTTELVLGFTNGPCGPKPQDLSVCQVVLARRREHSRKPDEIYGLIERLYPGRSKLELFARSTRDGWVSWGNETSKYSATV